MRFLIFVALAYLLYRVMRGLLVVFSGSSGQDGENGNGNIDVMVQDPICKTYVPERNAMRKVFGGEIYYFCSKACSEKFKEEYEKGGDA